MNIMAIMEANQEILMFSGSLLLILGLIKFFANKIIGLIALVIVGYNTYYFVGLDRGEQLEVVEHINKIQDTKGEYIKRIDPFLLLPEDTQNKLKSNRITNVQDLIKYVDDNMEIDKRYLDKLKKAEESIEVLEKK